MKKAVDSLEMSSHSAEQTRKIGAKLGELAAFGDVILLEGELGVGKTCLTQGIARGLGIDDYVISPTFVLLREYQGRLHLYHIDFYRLESIEEVVQLGLDDYLYSSGVCVVEWAEKGLDILPEEHLYIEMQHRTSTERKLNFTPKGARYVEMLSMIKKLSQVARK